MISLQLKKLFKKTINPKVFFNNLTSLTEMTDKVNKEKSELDEFQFNLLKEKGDEYYISLNGFLLLMEDSEYTLEQMISKFIHISDIDTKKFSFIEAYAIPQKEGILLSLECPKDMKSDKVRLVSFKKV